MMNKAEITTELVKKKPYINFKGLKLYAGILAIIIAVFIYLQINGISIFRDSNTEHEGNKHSYGNGYHK